MVQINCTAATLLAVLCFINPNNTPKIAFDDDSLTEPLIQRVKDAVGEYDGTQKVSIIFQADEDRLLQQFRGVLGVMTSVFTSILNVSK